MGASILSFRVFETWRFYMQKSLLYLLTACCLLAAKPSWSQVSSDVASILRASLTAQAGQNVISDVSLMGTVKWIAGSDDETVPFSFKGTLSGSARTDINLSAGALTEIRTVASSGPMGFWTMGNGPQHAFAGHNLLTDSAWCSPALVLERILSSPATEVSFMGIEDGLAHFSAYQPVPLQTPTTSTLLVQHLSKIELYLDPTTLLPAKLFFNTHPDNNSLVDLPVLVEFSNYQRANGVTAPMHIQRYMNGTLALDIQVDNVAVNSGLSSTSF
jgi:hypothetical protein